MGTALYLSAHEGETLGEPASHMKPIQHMASIGQILGDGSLI